MTRDVTPYLLVRCDTCYEESSCHPSEKMRWSVTMEGYDVDPVPICEGCWDEARHDHRDQIELPNWDRLEPVVLPSRVVRHPTPAEIYSTHRNTRFSDSSYYDEVCKDCGLTDSHRSTFHMENTICSKYKESR